MAEIQTEQQKTIQESSSEIKNKAEEVLQEQIKTEASEKEQQLKDSSQVIIDKANQELAKLPQKIEDDLDELNKKLKFMMGKNISPNVNVNAPEFDIDVAMADFNRVLNPMLAAVSPIEMVIGKVPVIGELGDSIKKFTTNNNNGGLTKEEINALVPNKPEIPQTLLNKVDETYRNIQEFCAKLPTLIIQVLISMLCSIYNMFNQIAGVIGVPPMIFPFNLVKQLPTMIVKLQDFVSNAPSQVKDIIMGAIKEKFAAAQALSIPKLPEASELAKQAKETASSAINTSQGLPSPNPSAESPIESPVVPTPVVQSIPPEQVSELTWEQVTAKWSERFHDEFNFKKEDISKMIECQKDMYDGSNDVIKNYKIGSVSQSTTSYGTTTRKSITPNQVDKMMLSEYNTMLKNDPFIWYKRITKASTLLSNKDTFYIKNQSTIDELTVLKDKIVSVQYIRIYPEKKWFGIF